MHDRIARWFANETFETVYILLIAAVVLLPMIALARWYHRNIGRTEGGRRLMREQRRNQGVTHGPGALSNLPRAAEMARDISRGEYGPRANRMQRRVYVLVTVWLVVAGVVAGAGIYFMEAARALS